MLVRDLLSRAKVESRNNLETYLYNLKSSYEDSLADKIAEQDLEELRSAVGAGLEVCCLFPPHQRDGPGVNVPPPRDDLICIPAFRRLVLSPLGAA